MGIPLRQGRLFLREETSGVVVVNESFARAHGGNVVGRLMYQPRRGFTHEQLKPELIVGVVGDVRAGGAAAEELQPVQVYRPSTESFDGFARFMVRTTGAPGAVLAAARKRVAAIDAQLPLLRAAGGHRGLA